MNLDGIRTTIEEAVSASVNSIQLPGILDAAVRNVAVTSQHLQQVATHLERHGQSEIRLSADVELFLRISGSDVLSSIQSAAFRVRVDADRDNLRATASAEEGWALAWERGIEPIRQFALQSMKEDVWKMDATLAEDSYTFQAAMVLLASAVVGPYIDRLATFLEYPRGLVQVMAARLYEAKIWENDEVRDESWVDSQKGGIAFLLDVMVAQGDLIRRWSEEQGEFAYCKTDIQEISHLTV